MTTDKLPKKRIINALDNTVVYDGSCSEVTIIVSDPFKEGKEIIDNSILRWNSDGSITLYQVYRQLKALGYDGVFYVWEETPLNGKIYRCNNYEEGVWEEYGKTRGYA